MKFPFPKSDTLRRVAVICLLAAGLLPPVHGQVNAIKKAATSQEPANPEAPEKPEDVRKRLEQWQQEARDSLSRLDASTATLPQEITPEELDQRRRDLEQIILTASRSIKNINIIADTRKALERARSNDAEWSGFTETPPYSILMVDELLNEKDAILAILKSSQSSLTNYERLLSSLRGETKSAEEAVSAAMLAFQTADDATRETAKWRMEAARAKSRGLVARAALMQSIHDSLQDRISAATTDLALVDRKLKIATASTRFDAADLTKIETLSGERKKAFQKELDAVSKRLKSAMTARNQAQVALDALPATSPQDPPQDGLELARFRFEVAEQRVESIQSLVEGLESLIQLENINYTAYQERRALLDAAGPDQRDKALSSLKLLLDRLASWENVAGNDISASAADLSKLEARASSITPGDPRFSLLNEQRAIHTESLAMLQRVSQAVATQSKLLNRWVTDFTPKPGEEASFHRTKKFAASTWTALRKIWGYQVTNYVDSVEVDGQTITGNIPVTLGMLLRALLFFVIGYWIATKIANRIQTTLITRGHLAETNAKMLRNWLMIVVGVFLAIGTLSFLRIPLTIFAFFGGALAIGVGFGMQTLIKNFISGIIVLAERKIRVGDILDVDGVVGTVVEVNTRSSILKSADDVETMIPNSVFLENRVTNWTLSSGHMRRSIRVGVAYGTDPQKVMEILAEVAGRHGLVLKHPAPYAIFEDFGDNALLFTLYFWINLGGGTNGIVVASDLRLMIEKQFAENKIGVPFPQREMHLTTDKPIQMQLTPAPKKESDPSA
ncbi:MAG: mechanosensitive ion channel domain-containing protein [Luteolibacter sp.]